MRLLAISTQSNVAPRSVAIRAFRYYDNVIFGANSGAGVFLCEMDIPNMQVHMSRVGLSDPTSTNDGMNCGPPALLPFAACAARLGPGTAGTTDPDCGPGWLADDGTDTICDFDPLVGLGCNTGHPDAPDQRKCCNLDCAPPHHDCSGHGAGAADAFDTACSCSCDLGYAGASCDQCSAAYEGYPECVLTRAPTANPTANPTGAPTTPEPTSNPTGAPTVSPDLSIDSVQRREGRFATLTVSMSRAHDHAVTVDWTTTDGTGAAGAVAPLDYEAGSGTLTIDPGDTSATIRLTLNDDADYVEPTEVFGTVTSTSFWTILPSPPMPCDVLSAFAYTYD